MRARGITYDTGFTPGGRSSRPDFDPDAVRREIRTIAEELHCDAVRITGGDPERLTIAARHAVDAGLEVWFSPFPSELSAAELLPYFDDCAQRAAEVGAHVFVTGCELSLFGPGFLPGADTFARIATLGSGFAAAATELATASTTLNELLAQIVTRVRERFSGKVTYASGLWESIDWTPFDIIGVDAYGDPEDPAYRAGVRELLRLGKPLAATEVGCCTYRGAADRGGIGWDILDYESDPPRIIGDHIRDEDEPVRYMRALFALFEEEAVDTGFWFTFAGFTYTHRPDPHYDLDLASYGVCAVQPDGSLTPKRAFHALAEICRKGIQPARASGGSASAG
ncbi:hypothetical protein ACFXHA_34670 [Nocardia sp. NPDC059240]|uniref:hypothetical protein n=1 Tax=Nocardia sp. NPDC059240 TaxID=3346786 RepID=UPI00367EA7F5